MERSLRSLPPTYAPSLVFTHGKKFRDQTYYTLFDQDCHARSVPEMRGMRFVALCHGWLVLTSYASRECYLFNPVSLAKIHLPPVLNSSFCVGALTSTPSDPNCFVVLYGEMTKSIIFCRIGGTKWIEQELIRDKKRLKLIQGPCDAISCNGKIYLTFFRDMVMVDIRDAVAYVELHKNKFSDLSIPETVLHSDFLVESCGEIYKVIAIHLGEFTEIIKKFDVLKLDFHTMDWVNVDSIGDRIFLVGRTPISVSTSGLKVKGNRIYLTIPRRTMLYMFDMDDGTVTTTQPLPKNLPHWGEPFWVVPDCKFEMTKEVVREEEVNIKEQSWRNFPTELLGLILSPLSLGDCMRFRLTSKRWASITPSVRLNPTFLCPNYEHGQLPWLMSFANINKGVCTFYHPIYGDTYTMSIPQLEGAIVRNAKYGWLLMSREDTSIFFFNPLTTETVRLPDLDEHYSFLGISFSAPPTSSECVVYGQIACHPEKVSMLVYYKDNEHNEEWNIWFPLEFDNKVEYDFVASNCNPVFYGGLFYCLSRDGKLGVFDTNEREDEKLVWKVLSVPPIFPYTTSADFGTSIRTFLVESNAEMFSVFVDFRGKPIWVYKLDLSKEKNMKWERLKCLSNKILFLSHATSMLLPACLKGIGERVYFPSFHEDNNMFYSLSTGRYHCFKCIYRGGECKSACEYGNCTWIQFTT